MTWLASVSATGVHQYEVGNSDSLVPWITSEGSSFLASAKLRALFQ